MHIYIPSDMTFVQDRTFQPGIFAIGVLLVLMLLLLVPADSFATDVPLKTDKPLGALCSGPQRKHWSKCSSAIFQYLLFHVSNQLRKNLIVMKAEDVNGMCSRMIDYWDCLKGEMDGDPENNHRIFMSCKFEDAMAFLNQASLQYAMTLCRSDRIEDVRRYTGCLFEPEVLPKQQQCTVELTATAQTMINDPMTVDHNDQLPKFCKQYKEAVACAGDFLAACCGTRSVDVFTSSMEVFQSIASKVSEIVLEDLTCEVSYKPDPFRASCNGFLYPPLHSTKPTPLYSKTTGFVKTTSMSKVTQEKKTKFTPKSSEKPLSDGKYVTPSGGTSRYSTYNSGQKSTHKVSWQGSTLPPDKGNVSPTSSAVVSGGWVGIWTNWFSGCLVLLLYVMCQ